MAVITDIQPQVKDKTRVNVYLDGRFCCGLDFVTLAEYRLKIGQEITEERLAEIQLAAEREKAFQKAASLISASAKTERELFSRLKEKGYAPPLAAETVKRLKEYGYVDDGEYAREYALSHAKKKGKLLISMELRQKGISEGDIAAALSETDETEGAQIALNKYMKGKKVTKEVLQKAYRHLMAKGFSGETVREALGGLKEELADED